MKINQKMIADQLGISVSTVSRSLADNPAIPLETRRKVQQMARRLGYHSRKPKAGRRLTTIGVVVHESQIAGATALPVQEMMMGITEAASAQNVSVPVQFVRGENIDEIVDSLRGWPPLRSRQLSGLVLLYAPSTEFVDEIALFGPTVVLGQQCTGLNLDCVVPENITSMALLVRHLREIGHHRIGFVADGRADSCSYARYGGYAQAMLAAGLDVDSPSVINVSGGIVRGGALIERIKAQVSSGVTAFVCADNAVAGRLIQGLSNEGIQVPQHVSITGFDSVVEVDGCSVTAMVVPWRQLGRTALQRVRDRVDKPTIPTAVISHPGKLHVGATSAPPAAR